jgi:hypothetical protein
MEPAIWSKLPDDLLECIASFADMDSRRALGFKPRKLPKSDLKINPLIWKESAPGYMTCIYKARAGKIIYRNEVGYVNWDTGTVIPT